MRVLGLIACSGKLPRRRLWRPTAQGGLAFEMFLRAGTPLAFGAKVILVLFKVRVEIDESTRGIVRRPRHEISVYSPKSLTHRPAW